ncbi:MAG: hypothetical protein PUC12_06375 [Clostridiales bacterium]|nr:hypothetical protein [Clostridiales bacterium]
MNNTESIQRVIEESMQQLRQEEEKLCNATPEEAVIIEKTIRKLNRDIKYFREALELCQEQDAPKGKLASAKLLAFELVEKALQDNVDMNSADSRLVTADRLGEALEKLELLHECEELKSMEFPTMDQFTDGLNKYIQETAENVSTVMEQIKEADSEIERIAVALEDAKAAGDIEQITEYGDSLEDAKKKRDYMQPILDNAMNRETFPIGTISQEWRNIADIYKYEWYVRLEIVKAAASLYHSACKELDYLTKELKAVRYNLQSIARENGSREDITKNNQIITAGATREDTLLMAPDENGLLYRIIFHNRSELL